MRNGTGKREDSTRNSLLVVMITLRGYSRQSATKPAYLSHLTTKDGAVNLFRCQLILEVLFPQIFD